MSNIIHSQFGQCGNRVGNNFWNLLRKEHYLDTSGHPQCRTDTVLNENIGVFFHEHSENKFVPRALLVDLEPGPLEDIKSSPQGGFYRPDNYINGKGGGGNNWAIGHYTEGAELADQVMDLIRAEVERTDSLHGFQILHNLSGGTGSGMGTLILMKLREEYSDRMLWTYSCCGSSRVGDSLAFNYNKVLAMHQLIELADLVAYLDDDAIYSIAWRDKIQPTYHQANIIWADILSDITSSMRFPAQSRADLRKLSLNLVPFPRAHFVTPGTAPLSADRIEGRKSTETFSDITSQLFNPKNLPLENYNRNAGAVKCISASCVFRGAIPTSEIDQQVTQIQNKQSSAFVEWIPDNLKISLCEVPPCNLNISATLLANTTAIIDSLITTKDRFQAMFKRRAFLQWYMGEGMDELEFTEAVSNLEDLIGEYQQYQDAMATRDLNAPYYCSDDEVE